MPDERRHRGPHPADHRLFSADQLPALRLAVGELSWLLGRGYSVTGALELVGDRHSLRKRQRQAVQRAACTDDERASRAGRRLGIEELAGRDAALDAFNCIIAVEAALSGGVIVLGRDRVCRDMSSVHGSYRRVEETERAVALLAETLASAGCGQAHWMIDRPVSNSGRLAALIREVAGDRLPVEVSLHDDADRALGQSEGLVICTGDSVILDRCGPWLDLPAAVIAAHLPDAWVIDLATSD